MCNMVSNNRRVNVEHERDLHFVFVFDDSYTYLLSNVVVGSCLMSSWLCGCDHICFLMVVPTINRVVPTINRMHFVSLTSNKMCLVVNLMSGCLV